MDSYSYISPLGLIEIEIGTHGLRSLQFRDASTNTPRTTSKHHSNPLFSEIQEQLNAYFDKKLRSFDLPLEIEGTAFQQKVWHQLMHIPYGTTLSYAALAAQLGDPKVIRAAASANGRNPILLIIPCHRVIGLHGSLTGYAAGLDRKQWLLTHEGALAPTPQTLF